MPKTLDEFLSGIDSLSDDVEEVRKETVILIPFQVEAYESWVKNNYRGTIIAPTGTGKTIIAGYAIKKLNVPTLIVCPTERILKMWIERLREKFGLSASAFYGGSKKIGRITVTIYNTVSMIHPELLGSFNLIVLDEVHHAGSEVFSSIIHRLSDDHKVMALTATLKREDERHMIVMSKLPVVYCLDLATAIKHRLVAPVEVIPIGVDMNDRERREYSEIERKISNVKNALKTSNEDEERRRLERQLKIYVNQRRTLLSRLEAKKQAVYNIALKHPDERVLVFSESIDSIEGLKKYLLERGVKAETYHSNKPESIRDLIFRRWGAEFNVLLSCRALDEGIDVPECGIAVMIASGMSVRQLVQRKGRIMRAREGKIAKLYVVYAYGSVEAKIPMRVKAILSGIVKLY
jgi:superfamily II DNA or RNA helicase